MHMCCLPLRSLAQIEQDRMASQANIAYPCSLRLLPPTAGAHNPWHTSLYTHCTTSEHFL